MCVSLCAGACVCVCVCVCVSQDLPLDKTALQYVEDTARAHDPSTSLEKCRQALGALGMTNTLALQPIGEHIHIVYVHVQGDN